MLDDLTKTEQATRDRLAAAQCSVLESIAQERPLTDVFERIVTLAEAIFPHVVCAILVADALGWLRYVVAPSLSDVLLPQSGRIQPFSDIRLSTQGVDYSHGLRDSFPDRPDAPPRVQGLHGCWRKVLCKRDGSVIGAFEVYCKQDAELQSYETECLENFMRLVHVTIANDQARRSEHLRAVILDSVEDAIFFVETESATRYRLISVNQAFNRLFGVSTTEIAGKMLHEVLPPTRLDSVFAHFARAAHTKAPQRWEAEIQARTGEKHGEITIVPIEDSERRCSHFVGVVHDVTARFAAERDRAQLRQKLNQAQRMQALGTLAGGIAHDFNNILAAIGGNARELLEGIAEDSPLHKRVLDIEKVTGRAVELVRQILTFSRNAAPSYRVFDPRSVTEEALNLLRSTLPRSVQIVTSYAPDVPRISADPTQFHQILINLLTNAAHAVAGSNAPIEVALMRASSAQLPAELRHKNTHAHYLLLRVTDRGSGMDAATLKRVFEPFFTTRAPGEGTGLGLSVVHGIVESHGGHIEIKSSRAHGTEVRVYLPAIDAPIDPTPSAVTSRGHGERVMYVDDEEGLVELMDLALGKLGYRVFGFTDPIAALDAFASKANEIDVVITDIAMPHLSGTRLAKRLRAIRSDIPIIMVSGYIRAEDREAAEQLHIDQLVYKSNTIDELATALATEIERLTPKPQ